MRQARHLLQRFVHVRTKYRFARAALHGEPRLSEYNTRQVFGDDFVPELACKDGIARATSFVKDSYVRLKVVDPSLGVRWRRYTLELNACRNGIYSMRINTKGKWTDVIEYMKMYNTIEIAFPTYLFKPECIADGSWCKPCMMAPYMNQSVRANGFGDHDYCPMISFL